MKRAASLIVVTLALAGTRTGQPIRGFSPDQVNAERKLERHALDISQPDRIRAFAKWMSAQPHAAGSPRSRNIAKGIEKQLREWGWDVWIESFDALLPYPTVRVLEMVSPKHFAAELREPPVDGDKDASQPSQIPTYNAYSASGDVTAPIVYVNFGEPQDYEELARRGLDASGKIVIVRYGRNWRGAKPKLAQEHGAVGCIIYSDPHEDGYFEGDVYPAGPFRPAKGVQRGSVIDMPVYPGDPQTPGWASTKGASRLSLSDAKTLLRIPVLPISADDAQPLLESLTGPVAPADWRGALPITYHIGPGPATVHLKLDFDWTTKPVYDVIARMSGAAFPNQWVMWGNHHDAWVNGAIDPVSSASALLEAARALGELARRGWKPKRSVLVAFWDAEEFGLIGSTEWAEKHQAELGQKLAAYLNSDSTGRGTLNAAGSHTLETFVRELARDIADPVTGKSLEQMKRPSRHRAAPPIRLAALGAGSDYVPFLDHLGVSSLNLSFSGEGGGAYHSAYDTFQWYARFSDGDYRYCRTLAQVMTMALLRLADAPVLPYDFEPLARTLRDYAEDLEKQTSNRWWKTLDLREVRSQVDRLDANARTYNDALAAASPQLSRAPAAKLANLNITLYRTERALLSAQGLRGRAWYRHQLYAPGLYDGYAAKTLPAIREPAESARWEEANRGAGQLVQALKALNRQVEEGARQLRDLNN